jgi:hypothetical protein
LQRLLGWSIGNCYINKSWVRLYATLALIMPH